MEEGLRIIEQSKIVSCFSAVNKWNLLLLNDCYTVQNRERSTIPHSQHVLDGVEVLGFEGPNASYNGKHISIGQAWKRLYVYAEL